MAHGKGQIERLRPDSEGAQEVCKNARLRLDSSRELGSQGAQEACKNEHLRPDSSRDRGVRGCTIGLQR